MSWPECWELRGAKVLALLQTETVVIKGRRGAGVSGHGVSSTLSACLSSIDLSVRVFVCLFVADPGLSSNLC